MRVTVGEGKYTVVMGSDFKLHALRYGQPWRDCVGDGLVLALAQEIRALRDRLELVEMTNRELALENLTLLGTYYG